eukprot:6207282-Pleurochrysis_carterae.AAC.3
MAESSLKASAVCCAGASRPKSACSFLPMRAAHSVREMVSLAAHASASSTSALLLPSSAATMS